MHGIEAFAHMVRDPYNDSPSLISEVVMGSASEGTYTLHTVSSPAIGLNKVLKKHFTE